MIRSSRSSTQTWIFSVGLIFSLLCAREVRADLFTSADIVFHGEGGCNQTGTSNAACSDSITVTFSGTNTFTSIGSSTAKADYGILRADTSVLTDCNVVTSTVNCFSVDSTDGSASAGFGDLISIANAPSNGSLDVTLLIHGQAGSTCVGDLAVLVCQSPQVYIIRTGSNVERQFTVANGTSTLVVPYLFSSTTGSAQVDIALELETIVKCGAGNNTTCTSFADYKDTAIVRSLNVLDANGQLVQNATITTRSGTDYNSLSESTVPEPSTAGLVGSGIAFIATIVRRRR